MCLESDYKVCIDGILDPSVDVSWRIEIMVNEIRVIMQFILSASFSWVSRQIWLLTPLPNGPWQIDFFSFVDGSFASPIVLHELLEDGCFVPNFLFYVFCWFLIKSFIPLINKK